MRYPTNHPGFVPFEWGKESPGATHLAEALLTDCVGASAAKLLAQEFASSKLAKLPTPWEFTCAEIKKWHKIRSNIGSSTQRAGWGSSELRERPPSSVELSPSDFPDFPVDPLKRTRPDWLAALMERIRPEQLVKQGFPRPKEVRLFRDADSTGEEAFYVYLIFPDNTPEQALAWQNIEPMVSWVRDLILSETDSRLWPYVKVKRQKEMAGGLA